MEGDTSARVVQEAAAALLRAAGAPRGTRRQHRQRDEGGLSRGRDAYGRRAGQARRGPRLITGQSHYVDDIRLVDLLYAAVVRSPIAHGRIKSIDVSRARAPGVVAVYTARDPALRRAPPTPPPWPGCTPAAGPPRRRCAWATPSPSWWLEPPLRDAPSWWRRTTTSCRRWWTWSRPCSRGPAWCGTTPPATRPSARRWATKRPPRRLPQRPPHGQPAHGQPAPGAQPDGDAGVAPAGSGPQQLTVWSSSQILHLLRTNLAPCWPCSSTGCG